MTKEQDRKWTDRELRRLNGALFGFDLPLAEPNFLLSPSSLPSHVEVNNQTLQRAAVTMHSHVASLSSRLASMTIPWVSFGSGSLEAAGRVRTITPLGATLEVNWALSLDPNAAYAALAHELMHAVQSELGLSMDEQVAELLVQMLGLGAIYLSGVKVSLRNRYYHGVSGRLGYLTDDHYAWAYFRASSHRGLTLDKMITPLSGLGWYARIKRVASDFERSCSNEGDSRNARSVDWEPYVCPYCDRSQLLLRIHPMTFIRCECGRTDALALAPGA